MDSEHIKDIPPGLYRINWKDSQKFSIASVGIKSDGGRWIAPTNWTWPGLNAKDWAGIESIELITIQHEIPIELPRVDSERIVKTMTTGEPEKIETEYELKGRLLSLLNGICRLETAEERQILSLWLKENKPVEWVQCTKENTKAGDEVRNKICFGSHVIEHIYREHPCCSVWSIEEERTVVNFRLDALEINIADK